MSLAWATTLVLMILLLQGASLSAAVHVSEQNLVIPTYEAGPPEPNPMFYFGKASQGAEGRIYPYPLYDTLTHEKTNKVYRIVYIENEYIRIGVLPEIGGRIFEGIDKSNGYNFFYRQHVIKPALIGLIGAWISGGVEWNIPHHHRATTFIPVQHRIESNSDGSKTIWVGELEIRHRMRWAVGYTLHPGKSYLETRLRILNRTPLLNSMLCFANVAVHVNEHYQVIFPPSTQVVTHHSKREFTSWPIAMGRYGGWDFGSGADASWYTNHTTPNSMFAWNYEDDFMAGYDHGQQAGTLSVANHHIVPGKKLWTWGHGPRGRMWDKILTDDDGPYIELMVGAYSDNQPDYSWLQPFETKSFSIFWYPFRDIGGVKSANLDAAVNLEAATNGHVKIGFCTTAAHRRAIVKLTLADKTLFEETVGISPSKPFVKALSVPESLDPHQLRASLISNGKELVYYTPVRLDPPKFPDPVTPPPAPKDISSLEELYLAGLRIEQFHHPSLEPEPYWEEALRRDPADTRVNTALGINYLKKARFADAERLFRKAIERLTARYTAPKEAEPLYYLGIALKAQGKLDEAFKVFYQATWSQAWRAPACYSLAEIASRRQDYAIALDLLDRSLEANAINVRALALKAAILRHLRRPKEALALLSWATQRTDPLDVRLLSERWLAGDKKVERELTAALHQHPHTALEMAVEYGNAGLWQDGTQTLAHMIQTAPDPNRVSPLAYYYLGHFAERLNQPSQALAYRQRATQVSPDYVFPFQWEAIHVLRRAIDIDPRDARAPYYLGNLLYDWQPEEAVRCWEQSVARDGSFPMAHRNLAVAYSRQRHTNRLSDAITHLEQAVALPAKYPLHFTELDELYAAAGTPPEKRLSLLEQNHAVVLRRDDALSREIGLKILAGQPDQAIQLMAGKQFSVWEGSSIDVAEHWVNAHLTRAHQRRSARQFDLALQDYQTAKSVPDNLPSERQAGGRSVEIAYWIGITHEAMGNHETARQTWQDLTKTPESGSRRGLEDHLSERQVQIYYQALARQKLGQTTEAQSSLRSLIQIAQKAREDSTDRTDYFESFGERQTQRARNALAYYIEGLGHKGLGETAEARRCLQKTIELIPDHLGARTALADSQ